LAVFQEPNPDVCPLCSAKLRPVFFSSCLFGQPPPCETEIEMYVDPEGWNVLENTRLEKKELTKEDEEKNRTARFLYSANKGIR